MRAALWMTLLLGLLFAVVAPAAPPAPADVATTLLDRLEAGRFDEAAAAFTDEMRAAVPAERLRQLWTSLPPAAGRGAPSLHAVKGAVRVDVPLERVGVQLLAQVAVLPDGRIAGFLVRPAPPAPAAAVPADAPYTEREASVGRGALALPATLAVPKGAGPFPAVVLVHGSGPQDRDETIGPNRPFLDIARGLAAQGIAVLRYEKRTKAHPSAVGGDFDPDDETTDDAVLAVELLRSTAGIDPSRVFVLGHSQGGMLAPRIARDSGRVAGLILLAAPARSLLDLLPEQNRYVFGLDGTIDAQETAFLAGLDATIAALRSGRPMQASETPLGLPAAYWRAMDAIDPVADAKAAGLPLLLLQGGRDFQVTAPDWSRWKAAFENDPRATLRHYPALDHLGIAGEGASTLASYQRPGHVDPKLIADIAEWIARH